MPPPTGRSTSKPSSTSASKPSSKTASVSRGPSSSLNAPVRTAASRAVVRPTNVSAPRANMQKTLQTYRTQNPVSRVSNPMSTQGASYKTPATAKAANKSYVDRSGFYNRVVKNLPSAMGRVEDKRVREQGPLDARNPRYIDMEKNRFDPNNPDTMSFPGYQRMVNKNLGEKDAAYRGFVKKDRFTTPREIAEKSSMMQAEDNARRQSIMNQVQRDRRQANTGVITRNQPNIGKEYNLAKAQASAALPDVKLGVRPIPRLSGIGNLPSRYKAARDALRTSPGKVDIGFRKGGLVKKKKR